MGHGFLKRTLDISLHVMLRRSLPKHLYHGERDPSVAGELPQGDMILELEKAICHWTEHTNTEDLFSR